ncbi:hypothetical protein OPV22_002010 [Ensete ventricosum]|uniref:DUF295 domain-containing protein n=1 Tax=Ensete ventricosum TaxID=4639 RepID=A0AAV8RWQ7_ENSVE|nr:hypothetical protein OPV22_002010 [Ensete ventricosum]
MIGRFAAHIMLALIPRHLPLCKGRYKKHRFLVRKRGFDSETTVTVNWEPTYAIRKKELYLHSMMPFTAGGEHRFWSSIPSIDDVNGSSRVICKTKEVFLLSFDARQSQRTLHEIRVFPSHYFLTYIHPSLGNSSSAL